MQLYDVLASAQGGAAVANLARAAGVAPAQIDAALRVIVSEMAVAIERNTLSRGGLADLVRAIGAPHHEYILDNPQAMADPRVRDDGNAVLEHVLGSKDRSRAVAMRAAQASGLGEGLIKMLLPFIGQMVMGAIAKWARGGLGDVLKRIPGGNGGGGMPFPMPEQRSGGRRGTDGGGFELPRSDRPEGGFPMPPMPDGQTTGGQDDRDNGGWRIPWPQQEDGPGAPSRAPRPSGGGLPFPFPFPLPGGGEPESRGDGGFGIPWPTNPRPAPAPHGRGGFDLPSSERPEGGYPMPPMPGGAHPAPMPDTMPPPDGGRSPLPMPGGGDNPYGDLSDILRRGGSLPGGGNAGNVVRDALGGLLGFGGRGVIGWIIRFLVVRFGWNILRRILGRVLTGGR
jgi:hypothetical protein